MVRTIFTVTALVLLFSIGLHIVHIEHEHPHAISGEGSVALIHGGDRRWWIVLFAALSILTFLVSRTIIFSEGNTLQSFFDGIQLDSKFSHLFDPIREALRAGAVSPRLYA